jgi:hypothetical protein
MNITLGQLIKEASAEEMVLLLSEIERLKASASRQRQFIHNDILDRAQRAAIRGSRLVEVRLSPYKRYCLTGQLDFTGKFFIPDGEVLITEARLEPPCGDETEPYYFNEYITEEVK